MLEYNRQGQSRQQGMLGRHQGVKGILGLDGEDMPPASMANMYWSSDFSRKLSCVKQYHSAERSVQSTKVNTLYLKQMILHVHVKDSCLKDSAKYVKFEFVCVLVVIDN